jgi:hypothetical protein
MNTLSIHRPRQSIEIFAPASVRVPVNWRRGELTALVGIEDLRQPKAYPRLLRRRDAEHHVHGVGHTPSQDLACRPIHYHHEVKRKPSSQAKIIPSSVTAGSACPAVRGAPAGSRVHRDGGMIIASPDQPMAPDRPRRIVAYAHRPRRPPRKKARAAAITVSAIVKTVPTTARRKPWVDNRRKASTRDEGVPCPHGCSPPR